MIVFPQAATGQGHDTFSYHNIDYIKVILTNELLSIGVDTVLMVDTVGNVMLKCGSGRFKDVLYPLAALVAGNFMAVRAMAEIIGEKRFSLFFHQGQNESIYYREINEELLLVVVFSNEVALGGVRMHIQRAVNCIKEVLS